MNNKLFWPIIIVTIVIIVESILLLSNKQIGKQEENNTANITPTEEIIAEDVVSFDWLNEAGKPILILTANKDVAIDAIDLYIAYKNVKVNSVNNLNELPKPTFSKVSTEKSLVVMNYLISEATGLKMVSGQSIRVAEFKISSISTTGAELSIDTKTQVVENGTAKVLPFNSNKLIVNSTL